MNYLNKTKILLAAMASSLVMMQAAADDKLTGKAAEYANMTPQALAERLIMQENGLKLDQAVQEGGTVLDRQTQDELQQICSGEGRAGLTSETTARVLALSKASIKLPEGGITLGDWREGEKVARSGYGFRVGHKNDSHEKRDPGGNCYACHQMDPEEYTYGTLGPSLKSFGKMRGNTPQTREYLYNVIYSPHTYFPCTHMPRFGTNGVLTEKQIADVMAYLLDPKSPVNK